MCDVAGFLSYFENFTVPYILSTVHIFWGVAITQDIQARSFFIRIGDTFILKNKASLMGLVCVKNLLKNLICV